MTEAQRQDVKMMVGLFQDVGGRVNGSVRAGRPFVAGVIEGFIVIPGVEIDVNGSVDALRGNVKTESRKPKAESAGQGSGTGKPALAAADAAEGP